MVADDPMYAIPPPKLFKVKTHEPQAEPAPRPLRWRIYYRTGQRVGSHQTPWEKALSTDVVAVVWQKDDTVHVELGTPYYCHLDDWIARCWDPTLYMRAIGKVKFGRWAKDHVFQTCWNQCIATATHQRVPLKADALTATVVNATHAAKEDTPLFLWKAWYDDGQVYTGESMEDWDQLPSDGVMCVYYHHVLNGIIVCMAVRRYTYYYWRAGELVNTDHLEQLVHQFSRFKHGCPSFTGNSYLDYGTAIATALGDTLEDIP